MTPSEIPEPTPFQSWTDEWLSSMYDELPQMAVADGIHGSDDRLSGYEGEQLERLKECLKSFQTRLRDEVRPTLLDTEALEYQLAETSLAHWLWQQKTFRSAERDPQYYRSVISSALLAQVLFPWTAAEERLAIVTRQLEQTGAVLTAAKKNLTEPVPIFVRYGIEQFQALSSLIERDLPAAFAGVEDEERQKRFRAAVEDAASAVKDFLAFLETDLKPRAKADFALGREEFTRMLRLGDILDGDPEYYAALAEKEIERAHQRWERLAARIDPNRSSRDLWQAMQRDHPPGGTLPESAQGQLSELQNDLARRGVVPVPERLKIQVLPTPEFFRWTFGSMWTPGPYEKAPLKSVYYITDVLPEWSEERKEQHLSVYNWGNLWMITIHEVFPGHGVQLAWLPDVPSALRKTILTDCTTYIEGWAHYAEELMVELGFTERDLRIEAGQIAEGLVRLCRTVAAIRMHLRKMTLDEATRLFVEKGWMPEASARLEAERGTFDPEYCLYTIGKWQLLGLRHLARRQNPDFSLAEFHSKILRGGVMPWRLYQQELLQEKSARAADLIEVFEREVAPVDPHERPREE